MILTPYLRRCLLFCGSSSEVEGGGSGVGSRSWIVWYFLVLYLLLGGDGGPPGQRWSWAGCLSVVRLSQISNPTKGPVQWAPLLFIVVSRFIV